MCNSISVSIIIPMFNASSYISDLIRSIQNQTLSTWEVIIVDDHSTDNSYVNAINATLGDDRFTIIKRPDTLPKGGDVCRNLGIKIAKGKYLIFVDADDILAPYCLEQRFIAMERSPELDCGVFPALTFKFKPLDYNVGYFGYDFKDPLKGLINKVLPFVVWNNIYRTDSVLKSRIEWDEGLRSNQDSDFNISCLIHGLRYKGFDVAPDYFWRQSDSLSQKIVTKEHAVSNLYYFKKITNIFKNDSNVKLDLKLFSLWMFMVLFKSQDADIMHQFLKDSYFDNHSFLRKKYLFFVRLFKKCGINSYKIVQLGLLILFPYLFMRRRYLKHQFPWAKDFNKNLRLLVNRCEEKMKISIIE